MKGGMVVEEGQLKRCSSRRFCQGRSSDQSSLDEIRSVHDFAEILRCAGETPPGYIDEFRDQRRMMVTERLNEVLHLALARLVVISTADRTGEFRDDPEVEMSGGLQAGT
jgi:hypothetical protein